MRFRIDVAYHGRQFHGWQRQPGLRTVQGELEIWLARLLGQNQPISLVGAGRTDAGVHSLQTPAHFDRDVPIDTPALARRLRVALPRDMCVLRLHRVAEDFHARYSAVARRYTYRIRLGAWPFDGDRQWQIHDALDLDALAECADVVVGTHDFSGFCRNASRRDNNSCSVSISRWHVEGAQWTYEIRADRFLHEMIRLLVGTFVAVARGRWPVQHLVDILRNGDVGMCGDAAPAHGLTLQDVEYPPGIGDPVDFD